MSKQNDHYSKPSLHSDHLADLRKSELSDETIKEAGIYSVRPADINKKLGFHDPKIESVMAIPYPGCNGFERYKIFPSLHAKKYIQPKGSSNHLYIPQKVRSVLSDPSIPLCITEGEKKAMKAAESFYCIALSGLWNWSNGNSELIEDFNLIGCKDRTIHIIPDNDWLEPNRHGYKKNLRDAVYELGYRLIDRGAKVFIVELPPGKEKGLDDYLCNHAWDWSIPKIEIQKKTIKSIRKNSEPSWPAPISEIVFHGLAGKFIRLVEQHTEADPAALLVQFLSATGNDIGVNAYWRVESDRHCLKVNPVLVGETSKGRKGTSLGYVTSVYRLVDPDWADNRISYGGLSSGEGLIWEVRDPITKKEAIKEKGRVTKEFQEVLVDGGMADKRLLVVEQEFSSPLKMMSREGNTLSATIRQSWDDCNLRILTKNNPARSTGCHISIIGHITRDELRRYLDRTEMANGFANRFLWVCVRRSKVLPEGSRFDEGGFNSIVRELREAIEFGKSVGEIQKDKAARGMWAEIYPDLSAGKPGLIGAVISRAEAQVMRLACLYAILDQSIVITTDHLMAALALWDYCEASVRYIWGDATGDPVADRILWAIRNADGGLSRTEIRDLFFRHTSGNRIDLALSSMESLHLIQKTKEDTGGRPVERWAVV